MLVVHGFILFEQDMLKKLSVFLKNEFISNISQKEAESLAMCPRFCIE